MGYRILFVDDDASGRELGIYNLTQAGYDVDEAADGAEGLERFTPARHDLVITDLRMPGVSGMVLLREVKRRAPDVPVLVITAHGSIELAVEAMRAGAYDFIEKPFPRDELLLLVQRAAERVQLQRENRELRARASGVEREILTRAPAMLEVLRAADRVATSDATVVVTGESGTGKELVARRIHARSHRADKPFVAINCAAMPAELLESELFGHEKGAYTGATRSREGRFRAAAGGTVFLDEVAEMPLALQAKLLRTLQERVVDVIGLDKPVPVDVRVVAATNRDLSSRITRGEFREDLYYRLNAFPLHVPALRERREDIPPLVEHFVRRAAGGRELLIPAALMRELERRPWPGNVRELENACERLVILCETDELRLADLPPYPAGQAHDPIAEPQQWPELPAEGLSLVDLEREVIERVLRLKGGNISQAASYLRVPRHVLVYRIAKYGIERR